MQCELITFEVAGQLFGLDIMRILEIRAWSPVTLLPKVPDYVSGVVNLRGTVVPVFDMSVRLGWEATEATSRNPIIVTDFNGQARGLVVDGVNDIVSFDYENLQKPDAIANDMMTSLIEGLAPIGENMVMILDLTKLMNDEEFSLAA